MLPGNSGVHYQMDFEKVWDIKILFGFAFALMPLCVFLTWEFGRLEDGDKKTSVVFIVIGCIGFSVYIRYRALVSYFDSMVQNSQSAYPVSFPFEQLYYEYYLMAGLGVGCLLAYLIFGRKAVTRWRHR